MRTRMLTQWLTSQSNCTRFCNSLSGSGRNMTSQFVTILVCVCEIFHNNNLFRFGETHAGCSSGAELNTLTPAAQQSWARDNTTQSCLQATILLCTVCLCIFLVATPSSHLDIFSCPCSSITFSRCFIVVVAKLKHGHVPSSDAQTGWQSW